MRQASVPSRDVAGTAPGSTSSEAGLGVPAHDRQRSADEWRNPRGARNAFLWPTLLVVLLLAIFPMVASLGLALSNLQLVQGGFQIKFIGLTNFSNLFFGADRTQFLGQFRPPTILGWVFFVGGTALTAWRVRPLSAGSIGQPARDRRPGGRGSGAHRTAVAGRQYLARRGRPAGNPRRDVHLRLRGHEPAVSDRSRAGDADHPDGCPASGSSGSCSCCRSPSPRSASRTCSGCSPTRWAARSRPSFERPGMEDFAVLGDPWGARIAVIIGDVWQWIPFMYIVLLAALEGRDLETEEAAHRRRRRALADLPQHHAADDHPGQRDRDPHPDDRGVQDHRPAECPHGWRPRHGDGVGHAAIVRDVACLQPRLVGGDRLHPVDRRHGRRDRVRRLILPRAHHANE